MSEAALKKAIDAAGGPASLGRALGISGPAVSQWDSCPHKRVLDVERLSGVSRHELRPDLYPPPTAAQPEPAGEAA